MKHPKFHTGCIACLAGCLLLIATGCKIAEQGESDAGEDLFSRLNGSHYVLHVDRQVGGPAVQFPTDALEDSIYEPVTAEKQYDVTFSSDLQTITIMPRGIVGELQPAGEDIKYWNLTQGLVEGGRFEVWVVNTSFQAEYTEYGSGVPIVFSERGALLPGG